MLCRVISDSEEHSNQDKTDMLKSMHGKIKRLFGKADEEEVSEDADDLKLDADDESEGDDVDQDEGGDQMLYWEVCTSTLSSYIMQSETWDSLPCVLSCAGCFETR